MKANTAEIERALMQLEETPRLFAGLQAAVDSSRLQAKIGSKNWSANEILAHLRACADLWTHSIYAMLVEKQPELPDIDERKWAKAAGYAEVPFAESLNGFTLQRRNLLRVLKGLPLEASEKSALIAQRKHTVFTQVRRMAKHEREHSEQAAGLFGDTAKR